MLTSATTRVTRDVDQVGFDVVNGVVTTPQTGTDTTPTRNSDDDYNDNDEDVYVVVIDLVAIVESIHATTH